MPSLESNEFESGKESIAIDFSSFFVNFEGYNYSMSWPKCKSMYLNRYRT